MAGLEYHEQLDGFAPLVIRNADGCRLSNGGVGHHQRFHIFWEDAVAGALDHFLDPAGEVEIAVLVQIADVAGINPAILQCLLGRIRSLPIAFENSWIADHVLTAFIDVVPFAALDSKKWNVSDRIRHAAARRFGPLT